MGLTGTEGDIVWLIPAWFAFSVLVIVMVEGWK